MWWNTLQLALREIRRHLLRSFLTILGIVIGVSAVITMVTLGNGATRAVQDQITSLGTNLLMVRPGQRLGPGSGGAPYFKEADAQAVATQIGGIRAVAPEVRSGGSYLSHNDMRVRFGLGSATRVDRLVIRWPSGRVETVPQLDAGRYYVIREGEGVVQGP